MKNIFIIITILLIFTSNIISQTSINWLNTGAGTKDNSGADLAIDNDGNVFVTGKYFGTVQFNDSVLATLNDFYSDIFLIRYNDYGTIEWVEKAGVDYKDDKALSISIDETDALYISGTYCYGALFGDTILYTNSGGWIEEGFVARYSKSGSFLKAITLNSSDIALYGIDVKNDYLAICGNVGPTLFIGNDTFPRQLNVNYGYEDIIFAQFDTNINYQLGKRYYSDNIYDWEVALSLSIDAEGSNYLTGYFPAELYADQFTLIATNTTQYSIYNDIFIIKHDSLGNVVWANSAGGSLHDYGRDITTDQNGNSYITGYFQGTATFGNQSITSTGGYDIFVACCSNSGQWQWVVSAGGTGDDQAFGISMNELGGIYITGRFENTISFTGQSKTSNGGTDIFLAKYDLFGSFLWAETFGSTSDDGANSIDVSETGLIALTGYFQNTMTIDTITISSNGGKDIFVASFEDTYIDSNYCGVPNSYFNTNVNFTEISIEPFYPYDTSQYFLTWQMGNGTEFYQITSVEYDYQAIDTFSIVLNIQDKNDSLCFLNIYDTIVTTCIDNLDFSMQIDSTNISFETSINLDTNFYQIIWDFGDSTSTANQNNPVHFYNSYGYKTITLSVVYLPDNTCNQQIQKIINVDSVTCIQSAEIVIYENVHKHAIFELIPYIDLTNYDILWNLGDGTIIANQQLIDHTFPSTTNYEVSCQISHKADSNCILNVEKDIDLECYDDIGFDYDEHLYEWWGGWEFVVWAWEVYNEPPNNYALVCDCGNGDVDSLVNDGEWYCDYDLAGNYEISFYIWDLDDSTCHDDLGSFTVTAEEPDCDVFASFSASLVSFDTMAVFVSAGGNPEWGYNWSFGDGSYGGDISDEHIYSSYGIYNICLTAHNYYGVGCYDTDCQTFTLGTPGCNDTLATNYNPNADFNNGSCIYAGTQPISLPAGWSIFSTYIEPYENNIDSVFQEIVGNTVLVKNQIGLVYYPQYSITLLDTLALGQGYQVKMASGDTLNVTGIICQPQNSPISLSAGWNIIGYLLQSPIDISQIFSTIVSNTEIVKDDAGNVYWPQFSVNNIGNMLPGKGYQVKMNSGDVLVY